MLFDLQSRRRRTAVKIIYTLLALLMAGGLVLLGVGTGSGGGGALNAAVGNGSSNKSVGNSAAAAAIASAQKQVDADPSSPAGYAALVKAHYEAAGTYYNETSGTYTADGVAQFRQAIPAWTKYASLVKGTPDTTTVQLAAQAYDNTGGYAQATVLWQDFISANPTALHGYQCLTYTAYAAKKTSLAQGAVAKVLSLTPKDEQSETKTELAALAKSKSEAAQAAAAEC